MVTERDTVLARGTAATQRPVSKTGWKNRAIRKIIEIAEVLWAGCSMYWSPRKMPRAAERRNATVGVAIHISLLPTRLENHKT